VAKIIFKQVAGDLRVPIPGKSMISNDRSSPYGNSHRGPPKPPVNEDTLKSDKVQIERKTFLFALKENPRGRFLRITEDVGGRRDTIIIPAPGLEEFKRLLDEMVKAAGESEPPPSGESQ
jgi:hypothetical protein